jgi:hypothetical protein
MEEPSSGLLAFDREAEVAALLDADETVAGDVWRRLRAGSTPQQIAVEDNVTVGPVRSFISLHNALLNGTVSPSPSVARGVAGRIRKWLKTKPLSDDLRRALQDQEQSLNAVVNDSQAAEVESEMAVENSRAAEAQSIPGIYVYTLPHYVRHPYDPKTGRTLLKVGHSSVDALYRATSQARVTSLPEDPWLMRVYPVEASSQAEGQFHSFLRDADHDGVRGTRTGAEWFLTSLKFLDRIASTLGLEVRIINDFAIEDER